MLARGRNTVNRHFRRFCPETLGPPHAGPKTGPRPYSTISQTGAFGTPGRKGEKRERGKSWGSQTQSSGPNFYFSTFQLQGLPAVPQMGSTSALSHLFFLQWIHSWNVPFLDSPSFPPGGGGLERSFLCMLPAEQHNTRKWLASAVRPISQRPHTKICHRQM